MKSSFHVDKALLQLKETLQQEQAYAVLVVSTTGIDNKECDKHSPTRVQLVQYEINDETHQYEPSITFDKMVAAPIEAVNAAIETAQNGGYDAFAMAGIDAVGYKAQVENPDLTKKVTPDKAVLTQEEFRQAFTYTMQAIQHDNTTLIANGAEHSLTYLSKIGCGEQLQEMQKAGKVIDQPHLGGEYLRSHGKDDLVRAGSATLENVRNFLNPPPAAIQKFEKPAYADDYAKLDKAAFLTEHPDISARAYDMKGKYDAAAAAKALAPERVEIIAKLVTQYGREIGSLESERQEQIRKGEQARHEMWSEQGKKRYQNSSVSQKLNTQIEMGNIDRDAILSGDSEYQRLMDALHGELGNKGVAFIHIATSGLNNPQGNETGLPLNLAVRFMQVDAQGKGLSQENSKGFQYVMQLPKSVVLKAEEQAKQRGGFDVFRDAGVDLETYKKGDPKRQLSGETFIKTIDRMFSAFKPEDYPIIVLGGAKRGEDMAFFQKALQSICNLEVINAPTIDFTQAVTAYALLSVEGEVPDNVIFGEKQTTGFGIRQVADALGKTLDGTGSKVQTAIAATEMMYKQYLELNPELVKAQEAEPEKSEKKEAAPKKSADKAEKPSLDEFTEVEEIEAPDIASDEAAEAETGEPDFADEDEGYADTFRDDDISKAQEAFAEQIAQQAQEDAERQEQTVTIRHPERPERQRPQDMRPAPAAEPQQRPARFRQETPVPQEQPEAHQETTQPARPQRVMPKQETASPAADTNVAALIEALSKQAEAMAQQNATLTAALSEQNAVIRHQADIIAKQDERLFELMQQQNELMKQVVLTPQAQKITSLRDYQKGKVRTQDAEADAIEQLDRIKDSISEICGSVPEKVREHLHDANSSISDGQAELENPEKAKEPKPVA